MPIEKILKVCPFCGDAAFSQKLGGYPHVWEVRCSNCDAGYTTDSLQQSIEMWESRIAQPAAVGAQELLEALVEARKFIASVTPRNIELPDDDIITFIDSAIAKARGQS